MMDWMRLGNSNWNCPCCWLLRRLLPHVARPRHLQPSSLPSAQTDRHNIEAALHCQSVLVWLSAWLIDGQTDGRTGRCGWIERRRRWRTDGRTIDGQIDRLLFSLHRPPRRRDPITPPQFHFCTDCQCGLNLAFLSTPLECLPLVDLISKE